MASPPPPAPPAVAVAPAEVPWEQIEAWAGGGAMPDTAKNEAPKKPDPKPDPKTAEKLAPAPATPATPVPPVAPATPAPPPPPPEVVKPTWTPAHPGEHRPEPPQIAEIRMQYIRHAEPIADRAEKNKDLERAFNIYYRMERYNNALQELVSIKQDPKRFPGKELWAKDKWFETGCIMTPPMGRGDLEPLFNDWKERKQAKMKADEARPDFNKDWKTQDLADLAEREKMYTEKPSLSESLIKREQQAEGDAAMLWDLANRYHSGRPYEPLREVSTLIKMREWNPTHEQVKNGEAEWRLVNLLSNDLELHKESAEEALSMIEKFPKNNSVTWGDALWTAAENRRMQAEENRTKKEQIEIWKDAKRMYEDFKQKHPQNNHNKPNTGPGQDQKSDCQHHIEELGNRLK